MPNLLQSVYRIIGKMLQNNVGNILILSLGHTYVRYFCYETIWSWISWAHLQQQHLMVVQKWSILYYYLLLPQRTLCSLLRRQCGDRSGEQVSFSFALDIFRPEVHGERYIYTSSVVVRALLVIITFTRAVSTLGTWKAETELSKNKRRYWCIGRCVSSTLFCTGMTFSITRTCKFL